MVKDDQLFWRENGSNTYYNVVNLFDYIFIYFELFSCEDTNESVEEIIVLFGPISLILYIVAEYIHKYRNNKLY